MDWQMLATLTAGLLLIVGNWWAIEARFEKKLDKRLSEVDNRLTEAENRLQAGIAENRQLIIKYIAKK